MILNQNQLHNLLEILDKQVAIFVGSTLGQDYLTDQQKNNLNQSGIKVDSLYSETKDPVLLSFQLGMLSDVLSAQGIKDMSFDQLKHYVVSGQHIPLSERERETIKSIKNQALSDIRANQAQIFQDINNVVNNNYNSVRANQEEFIREQVLEGIQKRITVKQISSELAKMTGDWTRNFIKSVSYISHTALNEGRLAVIQKRYEDKNDAKVWFTVQESGCEHCIRCYLKNGKASEPKIFTVRELLMNGSNIGKKAKEWLPVISALHVNCRCLINEYHEGTVWNGHSFTRLHQIDYTPKVKRNKVRVVINGIQHLV